MVVIVTIGIVVLLGGLAIFAGNHGLRNPGPTSSGGNALGAGLDVFDPGRGRMKEDLDSKETEGEMFAAPEGEDKPMRVDLRTGKVHIRKPRDDG